MGIKWRGDTRRIESHEVEQELSQIRAAFDQSRAELQEAAQRVEEQFTPHLADIFRAHEMMLDSLLSSPEFSQELQGSLVNAETAVQRVIRSLRIASATE